MEQALVDLIVVFCAYVSPETYHVALHLNDLDLDKSELQRVLIRALASCDGHECRNVAQHLLPMFTRDTDLGEEAVHKMLDNYSEMSSGTLVESNGQHYRSYMKSRDEYPCEIFEAYRDWAKKHDEWEEEDKELSYKCTF